MSRLTTADFHPEVLRLFDGYVHGRIDRRAFLQGASRYSGAGMTAAMLLEALSPDFALAQQVKPDDARIEISRVEFDSPAGYGKGGGYFVKPKAATGKRPVILVVHENRGLSPYIEDVARRLALDNYVAFAPDALFPLGGYPGDEDKARDAFSKLDQKKTREDFAAAAEWLRARPEAAARFGVVGFCWGGAMTNLLAVRLPWVAAAVPFYGGSQPSAAEAAKIKAAVLIHNAETDDWVNPGAAAYEKALADAGVRHQAWRYPGTVHGFHNDTTPRYNEAAAKLAWQRTQEWFGRELAA